MHHLCTTFLRYKTLKISHFLVENLLGKVSLTIASMNDHRKTKMSNIGEKFKIIYSYDYVKIITDNSYY